MSYNAINKNGQSVLITSDLLEFVSEVSMMKKFKSSKIIIEAVVIDNKENTKSFKDYYNDSTDNINKFTIIKNISKKDTDRSTYLVNHINRARVLTLDNDVVFEILYVPYRLVNLNSFEIEWLINYLIA